MLDRDDAILLNVVLALYNEYGAHHRRLKLPRLSYRLNVHESSLPLHKNDSPRVYLLQKCAFHTPYTSDQPVDSVNTIRWIKSRVASAQHDLGSKRSYLGYKLLCLVQNVNAHNS